MGEDTKQFEPGSFGCHEALHMASFLAETVDERLCEHPAIMANQEWRAMADEACTTLMGLYNAIAEKHL